MRFLLLTALTVSLTPSMALAQDWKDWANQNPTYPSQAAPAAPAQPVQQPAPSQQPAAAAPASSVESTQSYFFEQAFMKGCTSKGGAQASSFCACALNEVQNQYTYAEFEQMVVQMQQTGEIPRAYQDLALSCVDHI